MRPSYHQNCRRDPLCGWGITSLFALAIAGVTPTASSAYTAAGDRNFPAQLVLPQIGPTDAFWVPLSTQPFEAVNLGEPTRQTDFDLTYSKLITERLGIRLAYGLTHLNRLGDSSVTGTSAQNFHAVLQYEAILDPPHEFLLSVAVDHEFGGTGEQKVGSLKQSATQPAITFAKGFGDLSIGYWRPLAVTGFTGYQIGQGAPRPNIVNAGFSVQYSIPYLVSKVANVELPLLVRGLTPITEVSFSTPVSHIIPGQGTNTTLVVAPGVSYSRGSGWELAIEAMIPTTRATGSGIGVIAQLLIQLDYLLPDSVVGQPIFRPAVGP